MTCINFLSKSDNKAYKTAGVADHTTSEGHDADAVCCEGAVASHLVPASRGQPYERRLTLPPQAALTSLQLDSQHELPGKNLQEPPHQLQGQNNDVMRVFMCK